MFCWLLVTIIFQETESMQIPASSSLNEVVEFIDNFGTGAVKSDLLLIDICQNHNHALRCLEPFANKIASLSLREDEYNPGVGDYDLSILKSCTNLKRFSLIDPTRNTIDALRDVSVNRIFLGVPKVSDLSPLASVVSLKELWIAECGEGADVSFLEDQTQLEFLSLLGPPSSKKLSSVSKIRALQNLTMLKIGNIDGVEDLLSHQFQQLAQLSVDSPVDSLEFLAFHQKLATLDLSCSENCDLTPLNQLKRLKDLSVFLRGQVSSDFQLFLPSLKFLVIYCDTCEDFSSLLAKCENLRTLKLSADRLKSSAGIPTLPKLRKLTIFSEELQNNPDEIKALRAKMPKCRIEIES